MTATINAEIPPEIEMPSHTATERVGHMFGGVLLMLMGLLVIVVTIAAWHWLGVLPPPLLSAWARASSDYGLSVNSCTHLLQRWHLVLALLAGSGITYGGLCLILTRRKRETGLALLLLWGFAAWLIIQTTVPVSTFTAEASFKTQLAGDDVLALGAKLTPRVALATLPAGLRADLKLPADGDIRVAEFQEVNQPGVKPCVFIRLTFKPEASARQQALLADFYTEYLHRLAVPAAVRVGNQAKLELLDLHEKSGPDWLKWRETWLYGVEKELE